MKGAFASGRARAADPMRISPWMSFVVVEGRAVFLNVPADRYFILPEPENDTLLRLLAGETSPIDADLAGMVETDDIDALIAMRMCARSRPTRAFQADIGGAASRRSRWAAGCAVLRASIDMRVFGMSKVLNALARRRLQGADDPATAASIVRAHREVSFYMDEHDACLTRSLGLARHAAVHGVSAELVFGVRLSPFAAHCWVEKDGIVLNGELDEVLPFTPILVV